MDKKVTVLKYLEDVLFFEGVQEVLTAFLGNSDLISNGYVYLKAKMIEIFPEQTTDSIEKAETAIIQNNFMEVIRLIHKIKPSVESLGITSIISEMKILEKTTKDSIDKEKISALFL